MRLRSVWCPAGLGWCALLLCLALTAPAYGAFGLSEFQFSANEAPPPGAAQGVLGPVDVRAGSHPYSLTSRFQFATKVGLGGRVVPDEDLKDIEVALPPGLVGDPNATAKCKFEQFTTPHEFSGATCPNDSQVGVVELELGAPGQLLVLGIYNLVPSAGVPAEFGFNATFEVPVLLVPKVRTGSDYGLTVVSKNTNQGKRIYGARTTFWGVPSSPAHDGERGECLGFFGGTYALGEEHPCPVQGGRAFLTLPTDCSEPFSTSVRMDSWQQPGVWKTVSAAGPTLSGCEHPAFDASSPALSVAPDTFSADTPAGLTAEVKMKQDGLTQPDGIASAALRDTKVTLPEGLVINPGQAAGLAACGAAESAVGTEGVPSCPLASKVGTDEIQTPLLTDPLKGDVYVLQSNPPHLQILVAASADGVNLKLVGDVHLDEATGRVVTTFNGTPPLPFTDFKLAFSGGAQAALATPATCGSYQTLADFTPWTTPFEQDVLESSAFPVQTGPGGSACASPLPFAPSLTAGATTDQAGGFTAFSLLLTRPDGQQRVSSLRFKTPQGLLAMISKVPLCGEADANAGTCPAASQIGHTVVQAGPGPYPLVVPQPGQPPAPIYLTGGYKGAPYGLSIVVPLVVGPFTLETQIVRSRIDVDPHTSQITITTDPIPSIIDGIPSDVRAIDAVVDRPGFMFNPTDCSPMSFEGTATSTEGTTAPLGSHFQVGSCQSLKFTPSFKVSTSGKTSKANGASLDAKVTYPPGSQGTQANIAYVKVELPKQLPSRLTTLQKACLAAVFKANAANCPAASVVGIAKVSTPVLPVPLTGPVYFVSNGGEAFPNLNIVLQGYGVRVDLVGDTLISKAGVTSTTFKTVPDVPFNSFELYLPQGRYSALGAPSNLCKSKLTMPTTFAAQNGLVIHQNTKIAVTGCPKAKRAHKAKYARIATAPAHVVNHPPAAPADPAGTPAAFPALGAPLAGAGSAESGCANESTRNQLGATALPDCRAWEMVSPLDKNGGGIGGIEGLRNGSPSLAAKSHGGGVVEASVDGQRATFVSHASFGEAQGAANASQYLSSRSASTGWVTQNVTTPTNNEAYNLTGAGTPFKAFSADLSGGLVSVGNTNQEVIGRAVESPPLAPGGPAGYENLYLDGIPGGTLRSLLTRAPSATPAEFEFEFLGASPDLNHVVVSSLAGSGSASLGEEGEEPGQAPQLHEWDRAAGMFLPVSVLPSGAPVESSTVFGGSNGSATGQAISEDGSTVAWTNIVGGEALYVREGIGTPLARTVQADASQGGPDPGGHGEFRTASSDGAKVFFSDAERLTPESSHRDLYMFEPGVGQAGRLVDLTVDQLDANGADVLGVLGASADGSYVYFAANGVLAAGAALGSCGASGSPPGAQCNLYLWHAGETRFVATLSGEDQHGDEVSWLGVAHDWTPALGLRTARVSRDGSRVVFMSQEELKTVEFPGGYDNTVSSGGSCGLDFFRHALSAQCEEVFMYEAATNRLRCSSCNPSGARPTGPSSIPGGTEFQNNRAVYQSRVLSEGDGEASGRVFFNSGDGLVPQDTNRAEDVYEYENGHAYLLSDGKNAEGAQFIDASVNGNDVFFVTGAQLVNGDTDQLVDLYDARVGGGFANAPTPVCTGTGCQGVPAAPPLFSTPASATFSGPGNFPPPAPAKRKTAAQIRAEQLAHALSACRRKYTHSKRRRAACGAQARKRYGAVHRAERSSQARG